MPHVWQAIDVIVADRARACIPEVVGEPDAGLNEFANIWLIYDPQFLFGDEPSKGNTVTLDSSDGLIRLGY